VNDIFNLSLLIKNTTVNQTGRSRQAALHTNQTFGPITVSPV